MERDYSKVPKRLLKKAKEFDVWCDKLKEERNIEYDWRTGFLTDSEGKEWRQIIEKWDFCMVLHDNIPIFTLTDKMIFVAADWTPKYNEMTDGPLKYKRID